MSFRRLMGLVTLSLALSAQAQDAAQAPAVEPAATPAVTALPEQAPAAAVPLTEAHGEAAPGDVERGSAKAAVCAACHGMDGNSVDPMYPDLAGQHERYTARQLALYKSGERPDPIMMGFAAPLSPQDMRDLGAFFATKRGKPGLADEAVVAEGEAAGMKFYEIGERLYRGGDAERGLPACLACHGPAGDGNPGPAYPLLAGQHARYTADMLVRYRDGAVYGDSPHAAVMADVAKTLTDPEIQALGTYIEGLHQASSGALPATEPTAAR